MKRQHRQRPARALCVTALVLAILGPACGSWEAAAQGASRLDARCGSPSENEASLVFPDADTELQRGLDQVLAAPPYARMVARNRLSVVLVNLSDPCRLRYSAVSDNEMRYAASLPKIAILLTVFDRIDRGTLDYTPDLRQRLERMIRRSSNRDSTALIRVVGFEAIAEVLRDPRYELYDEKRQGGLWVGKDYGGGLGRWKRDPLRQVSHGATARQVARFFVMMNRGQLVSPWASAEMKEILGRSQLQHKFVRGLSRRPGSVIYRKSGTWQRWHADAALVERNGKTYVAVALLESENAQGVMSALIVKLDDLIAAGP